MNIAPIIANKQNQILRRFRVAAATNAERARSPHDLGCRESIVFRNLVARGILIGTSDARYYLDPEAADAFVATRRKAIFSALLIAIVVIATILLTR